MSPPAGATASQGSAVGCGMRCCRTPTGRSWSRPASLPDSPRRWRRFWRGSQPQRPTRALPPPTPGWPPARSCTTCWGSPPTSSRGCSSTPLAPSCPTANRYFPKIPVRGSRSAFDCLSTASRCTATRLSGGATSVGDVITVEDVRRITASLPRSYEVVVRDQIKFRVGRIVFAAFSRDEAVMGVGFPKEERAAMVAAEPDKFMLPRKSDMRYNWIHVRLAAIDLEELRELVIDAWRMCVPKKVAASIHAVGDDRVQGRD